MQDSQRSRRVIVIAVVGLLLLGLLGSCGLWLTRDQSTPPKPGALQVVAGSGSSRR